MYFLVYVSAAATWFSDSELRALLSNARDANAAAGITGMLLYRDGNFMQVIEGERPAVEALFERISRDRRHQGVVVLESGTADERQFDGWSMGFADLGADDTPLPPGYSDFLSLPLTAPALEGQRGRARELLSLFRNIS